ncbi:MAG: phosphotransferase [Rhodothermales bacterium]
MRPEYSEAEAVSLVASLYGIEGGAKSLPSYSDQNFLIDAPDARFVLKIANADEPAEVLDFQQKALLHVKSQAPELTLPFTIPTTKGAMLTPVPAKTDDAVHLLWMVSFLPGQFISDLSVHSTQLLEDVGRFMGTLDRALQSFEHEAMHRDMQWDLKNAARLATMLEHIKDLDKKSLVEHFLERLEKHITLHAANLRMSVIHNDANDNNVLITGKKNQHTVGGIIDFGDMLHSHTVNEVAIAIAYLILGKENILDTAAAVLRGYHRMYPLNHSEISVLFDLICLRLCTSVCMSAQERSLAPDNAYLAISEQPAWTALSKLIKIDPNEATAFLKSTVSLHTP